MHTAICDLRGWVDCAIWCCESAGLRCRGAFATGDGVLCKAGWDCVLSGFYKCKSPEFLRDFDIFCLTKK